MLAEAAGVLINDMVVGNCPVMSPETEIQLHDLTLSILVPYLQDQCTFLL